MTRERDGQMASRQHYYADGNTVRRVRISEEERQLRVQQGRSRKAKRAHRLMSISYLMFLTLSLAAAGIVLAYYIMLHAQLVDTADRISGMEKQLAALTQENDEAYNRISGSVDLEEVRRIAIQEYGMKYVGEGQIVTYSDGGGSDYVRQKAEIPDAGR